MGYAAASPFTSTAITMSLSATLLASAARPYSGRLICLNIHSKWFCLDAHAGTRLINTVITSNPRVHQRAARHRYIDNEISEPAARIVRIGDHRRNTYDS